MSISTVRYRDHAISYDKEGVTLVPFVDRHTGQESILVKCDDSENAAYYLEDLKVAQCLETSVPLDINRTFKNLDVAADNAYYSRVILIARVDSDPKDTLRAVYAGTEDKIPVFVAAESNGLFNSLDVGSVLILDRYSPKVRQVINKELATRLLHAMVEAKNERRDAQRARLAEGKKAYVKNFLAGEIETIFLDIFTITGNTFSYTDTEIIVDGSEPRERVLQMLAKRRPDQSVDSLLNHTAGRDNWYGFDALFFEIVQAAGAAKINRVEVTYEERNKIVKRALSPEYPEDLTDIEVTTHYVNGKKIAAPDVFTVITTASCYADRQKEYDTYVQQVSRISLKFHRAVASGILLEDSYVKSRVENGETDTKLPNDFGKFGEEIVACKLPVRKEHGSKAEVFLMDKWRRIKDFDGFIRSCQVASRRYSKHAVYMPNLSLTSPETHCCQKLALLDARLHPEDRVFPDSMLDNTDSSYKRGDMRDTEENRKRLRAAAAAFNKMFAGSMKRQYDYLKRSKELFDRIILQERAEVVNGGKNFIVTGASGRRYDISIKGSVKDLQSNRHICIVNGGNRELAGWDYLASLVAALAHDNRTAANVYTLQGEDAANEE